MKIGVRFLAGIFLLLAFHGSASAATTLRHNEAVVSVVWSKDGSLIATSSDFDRLITIWSSRGQRLQEIRRPSGSCGVTDGPLAFDADDRLVYTARDTTSAYPDVALSILDWRSGRWIKDLRSLPLPVELGKSTGLVCGRSFQISPDGQSVAYIYGALNYLALQSLRDGTPLHPPIPYFGIADYQWNPNRAEIALVRAGGTLEIRSIPDFSTILSIRPFGGGEKVAYSSDGTLLAVGRSTRTNADANPQVIQRLGPIAYPSASLVVIDSKTGDTVRALEIPSLPDNSEIIGLAFLPNNDLVVATPKQVYVRPLAGTAEFQRIYSCASICFRASLSPNGHVVAIVDGSNVVLLDLPSNR